MADDDHTCTPTPKVTRRDVFIGTGAVISVASAAEAKGSNAETGLAFHDRVEAQFSVNRRTYRTSVEPRATLLDWLREEADLTGTKKGCNEGACGACTVLIDGKRANSCLTLVAQCGGADITTIEGVAAPNGALHPVQQAFIDHDAFQCGYCTSGQIVSAVACIAEGHAGSEESVREWMSGNLCRCSCYPQITAAVLDAAGRKG